MDRIIFGDNQFFGINHMSEEKAQALMEQFGDIKSITDVLETAYDAGIKGFMLNANDRVKEICDFLRSHKENLPELSLYPSIPYPHKYANLVAEKGIVGAMADVIFTNNTVRESFELLVKGGASALNRTDMTKIMELLIDVEMQMFRGLNVKVVFLQNIVTDLILGLGLKEMFINYSSYIRKTYNAEPGFITMNLPKLALFLTEKCRLENPIICASINKIGYFMNPSVKAYEETIENKKFRPVAMSVYASGAISPQEAIEYICKQPKIGSIVFGASNRNHIEETIKLVMQYSQ